MRGSLLLTLIAMILSMGVKGAVHETVADGNASDPAVWDCSCTPAGTDDVVINHNVSTTVSTQYASILIRSGAHLTATSGTFLSAKGSIEVESGGILTNNVRLVVQSDYTMNGFHNGTGEVRFHGNGWIDGTGSYSNTKAMLINAGNWHVRNTANLDFSSSATIWMKNTARLINYGNITVYQLRGTGLNHVRNRSTGVLTVRYSIHPGLQFFFEEEGNTVVYSRGGSSNQILNDPAGGFYNLRLEGTGLSTIKRPSTDLVVNGELSINNCILDSRYAGANYDTEVHGDWSNTNGHFRPRDATVRFVNAGTIQNNSGTEELFNVEVEGDFDLGSDLRCTGELNISGTLDAAGQDIYAQGDWTCTGTFDGNEGNVIFEGSANSTLSGVTDFDDITVSKTGGARVISSGTTNVYETLWMTSGVLETNDNVFIASNAERTGRLGEMGAATFDGDLQVERFMSNPGNEWHLIGSSVQGMDIAEWNNDFITTGFTGANFPTYGFNSITKYDESVAGDKDEGVSGVSAASELVPAGEGRRAYIAGGVTELCVKGPAITGPFNWNISYTPSGTPDDDGWNLISNPYPSTIDWDDTGNWTRTGVKDALYVWVSEHGQFASYVAGVGTNGGTRYIASSQAFWVQADAAGPILSITEAAKSDEDVAYRSNEASYFTLSVEGLSGHRDELALRIDENATEAFDKDYDAFEWRSPNNAIPSISLTTSDEKQASIYSIATPEESVSIPMSLYVGESGTLRFEIENLSSVPALNLVKLYDAEEELTYDLNGSGIELDLEQGEYEGRFYLNLVPSTDSWVDVPNNPRAGEVIAYLEDDVLILKSVEGGLTSVDLFVTNALGQEVQKVQGLQFEDMVRVPLAEQRGLLFTRVINRVNGHESVKRLVR